MLISFLIVSKLLLTTIMANIFLSIDKSMIGLRFFTGPFGLPGLGRGMSCPKLSSKGLFPVPAILFKICAIWLKTVSGLFLTSSALI